MTGRAGLALVAVVAAVGLGAGARAAAPQTSVANPRVGCGDVIGQQVSGTLDGSRVVLGVVSVAPARLQRAAPTGNTPWTHFAKWGMTIHSGAAVQLSVPKAWRSRVAITWGASTPIVSTLHFAACRLAGRGARPWNGYPGGFYVNTSKACVPLTVTVGRRSRTVRFGIGESCRR